MRRKKQFLRLYCFYIGLMSRLLLTRIGLKIFNNFTLFRLPIMILYPHSDRKVFIGRWLPKYEGVVLLEVEKFVEMNHPPFYGFSRTYK